MGRMFTSICLLLVATPVAADIWAGPHRELWTASNHEGFCSLSRTAGSGCSAVRFTFALLPREDDQPMVITFHVTPLQCELSWPVRISLGSKADAIQFEVASRSPTPRSLPASEANQLLKHLDAGGELHISYAFTDGVARQSVLNQDGYRSSAAMFRACVAMSPNYAMQRSSLVVTPLAGTASGSLRFQPASGAPSARRR
jgi:hypothetical protein